MQSVLRRDSDRLSFPSFSDLVLINHAKELDADWGVGGYSAEGWTVEAEIFGHPDELDFANRGKVMIGLGGNTPLMISR